MGWQDISDIRRDLEEALATYDWTMASEVCGRLVRRTVQEPEPCPDHDAVAILGALRRKRRFTLLARTAEAFVVTGHDAPRVRRQYAQALIDQDLLLAAEPQLTALTSTLVEGHRELAEAHGLLGRIYKQRYVNAAAPRSRYARAYIERALTEYLLTYRRDPTRHYWHGVNAVALLHRASADGIRLNGAPDPAVMANEILRTLDTVGPSPKAFDVATRVEALVALGRVKDAEAAALDYYQHKDTDAFEAGSTLRQFQEVWRLTDDASPGSTILPLLRAAVLRGEGGSLRAASARVEGRMGAALTAGQPGPFVPSVSHELGAVDRVMKRLEQNFGSDKMVTLAWYATGLSRTNAVARIERLNGRGHGTGWLVDAGAFFEGRQGLLLVTNAHVVNAEGTGGALTPDQAQANFQGLGRVVGFETPVVRSSPADQLDVTFLEVKGLPPNAEALPISTRRVSLTAPPPRLYIVGHPSGRDLELSLHDNVLLGCNDRFLHYRTPTEGGSSGSPVFDDGMWAVVGLHHAGGQLAALDGSGASYDGNEGMAILAVQAWTRSAGGMGAP